MTNQSYHLPMRIRLFRIVARPIFRMLFHLLSNVRITGKENIPQKGAYLIAINHVSLFEPPLALAFWPTAAEAAGAIDIWERTGQSVLVRLYGTIPVHRGEYDRKLIDTMLCVLKSNRPLLIAPEGGRTHSIAMRRAQPGIAYLADQANVQVVPVGIAGTSDDFFDRGTHGQRPRIEMRIGTPFTLPPITGNGEERRRNRQKNADIVMEHIADLLPPEYHGVYGEKKALEDKSEKEQKGTL